MGSEHTESASYFSPQQEQLAPPWLYVVSFFYAHVGLLSNLVDGSFHGNYCPALFIIFCPTFQEIALAVTEADEELLAMLDSFVNNGIGWLFALVGTYTICTLMLMVQGARYLQEQAQLPTKSKDQRVA